MQGIFVETFIWISLTYAFCRCKTMLHRETQSLTYNFLSSLFFFFFYYHQPHGQRVRLFSTHLWAFLPFPPFFFCLFRTLSSKKLDLSRVSAIRTSGSYEKLRLLDLCQPYNLTFVGSNCFTSISELVNCITSSRIYMKKFFLKHVPLFYASKKNKNCLKQ